MAKNLVLVTGAAGRIGGAVLRELVARGHSVRAFDRVPTPGVAESRVGNLAAAGDVRHAMDGVGTVIHLAATPDDTEEFAGELVPNNIIGLHHLLEAARSHKVGRIVLASTGQVNDVQQTTGPFPIRSSDPVTPRYWYAATKMFMESIGYSYARRHGISVIAARLGWCPRTAAQVEEIAAEERFQDVYLSPGDAGRFFACAVEAPASVKWAVLYAASLPVRTARFDLGLTFKLINYTPVDRWPQGVERSSPQGGGGKSP